MRKCTFIVYAIAFGTGSFVNLAILTACFVYDLHAAPIGGCVGQFLMENQTNITYISNDISFYLWKSSSLLNREFLTQVKY